MFEDFSQYLANQERSTRTIKGYIQDLTLFARWYEQTNGEHLTPRNLTPIDAREYRQYLLIQQKAKPSTINRHLAALRSYSSWAMATGLVDINPVNGVKSVAQQGLAPKWLDRKEQMALQREIRKRVHKAKTEPAKRRTVRDAAALTLMVNTGLRISELAALQVDDIKLSERKGELVIRSGKGMKSRTVPLNKEAREALREWLNIRGDHPEAEVFTSVYGPLSTRSVQSLLQSLRKAPGLEGILLTPHVLRHTFAKNLVDAGISLDRVAALLGHSSLDTTRVYTTPSLDDLERAVGSLSED